MITMPTAGPYNYSLDKDTQGREGFRIDTPDVSLIAWIPIGYGERAEVEANARLFANSRDLLNMVKRLIGADASTTLTQTERDNLRGEAYKLLGKVHKHD